jgi:lipopolysaccharide/colanic/teichoic acid biosynthesis glycosyltransferase
MVLIKIGCQSMLKRSFDVFSAGLGMVFLAPFFIVIALWIKLDSIGPVFFRQVRVGRGGVEFYIHKFRTMYVDSESQGKITVGEDSRITASGLFLRKYKVDELPQLFDVLIGKMSLVGPRPEVPEFIDAYQVSVRNLVLSVRPGITDKASIEMIDENELLGSYLDPSAAYKIEILPIKQKYYLDYVKNRSFIGDLKIIFLTITKIISR